MTDNTNNYSFFDKLKTCYRVLTNQASHEDAFNIANGSPNINQISSDDSANLTPATSATYASQVQGLTFWAVDVPNNQL